MVSSDRFINPPPPLSQALYKLYNVAANHRQLYNHAFPGHQTDQQPEQEKKRN